MYWYLNLCSILYVLETILKSLKDVWNLDKKDGKKQQILIPSSTSNGIQYQEV